MATLAQSSRAGPRGDRFFMTLAIVMALVLVAGFSFQLAMGRSSFERSPWFVHLHALVFFGWTTLFVTQNVLAGTGSIALHRRLGWLAVGWIPAMVVMGLVVTVAVERRGAVPFFFTPAYFLVMDPLSVFTFAGLATAALVRRRETAWHSRLMLSGMTVLTGPGLGRLLPVPFLIPYAGAAIFAVLMLFPLAGVVRDIRRAGKVHPAWLWGIGALVCFQLSTELLSRSGIGVSLYEAVVAGTPAAMIDPQAYPPPPWAAPAKR
jgi:hypothetical protein